MNKYKTYGKGWHFESHRHSLAAKGVKTTFAIKQRPNFKYVVEFLTMPYGKKSPMRRWEQELAVSREDAEEWKKVLEKDENVLQVRIKKLPEGE